MDQEKRILRKLKRDIKRAGNKRRRQQFKRDLDEHPENAPFSEESLGRYRSEGFNGMDKDATRQRPQEDAST